MGACDSGPPNTETLTDAAIPEANSDAGATCTSSAECLQGQVCCAVAFSAISCLPTSCPAGAFQVCRSSDECVQPGFACGVPPSAVEGEGGALMACLPPWELGTASDGGRGEAEAD